MAMFCQNAAARLCPEVLRGNPRQKRTSALKDYFAAKPDDRAATFLGMKPAQQSEVLKDIDKPERSPPKPGTRRAQDLQPAISWNQMSRVRLRVKRQSPRASQPAHQTSSSASQ